MTVDFERRGLITIGHHDLTCPLRPGVDGIITDRPTALVAVLDRLGCAWTPGA